MTKRLGQSDAKRLSDTKPTIVKSAKLSPQRAELLKGWLNESASALKTFYNLILGRSERRVRGAMDWAEQIDDAELEALLARSVSYSLSQFATIDDLGQELAIEAHPDEQGFGFSGKLWNTLKREFRALLCQADPKYTDLRKQLNSLASQSTTGLVAAISGALGASIGDAAAVISPMVALLLLAAIRLGKEAFCATVTLDQPLSNQSR
jgi:hypothetical protein